MSRALTITLMLLVLGASATPSGAQDTDLPCDLVTEGATGNAIDACIDDEAEDDGDDDAEPNPGPTPHFVLDTQGEPRCWQVVAIYPGDDGYADAPESYADVQATGEALFGTLLPLMNDFAEAISNASGGIIDVTIGYPDLVLPCEAVDPEVQAYLVWRDTVTLPPPASDLDPGTDVVTGMDTYLTIGEYAPAWDADADPRTVTYEGPIRIVASAEHQVDWGDGTVTPSSDTWHQTNGRAWSEDGDPDDPDAITHVYQDATEADSTYTITVTTRWTARWETLDGSASGIVPFFRYSESTVDLDVDEVQPVVIEQS